MNVPQPTGRAPSNSWRRSTGSPPVQANNNTSFAQAQQLVQMQQQQFMQQQQELYALQQAQMELQLQQLRMQNSQMQERLLAVSSSPYTASTPATADNRSVSGSRRSALMSDLNMPASAPSSQSSFASPNEAQDARRGALKHLQRAQQQRSNSTDSEEGGELRMPKRGNRLSFVGGEGLAEHALARKRSGAFSPPPALPSPTLERPASAQTHHRKTSSNSSNGSSFFQAGERLMSPPGGPTLVLSEPGDKYPSPTFSRYPRPRALNVNTEEAQQNIPTTQVESDASSPHSSDTDSNSEVASFESTTTVASTSESMKPKRAVSESAATFMKNAALNPAASTFTPGNFLPVSQPATTAMETRHKKTSTIGLNYPSTFAQSSPSFRNFTAPPVMVHGAVAVRQPKGPAKEDELEQKNFNGRMRKQALRTLNRRSFVPPVAAGEIQ